ncbi:MAG: Trk family potassium uptake protein [Oscillospiraceae bacterium]|nr:Trk family potassium uptake protein [Oscillospiraceae bacterium]
MSISKSRKHWTSFQVIIAGFAALILTGTALLMLPFSSRQGKWTPFIDALFTSTSASCVTGLIVQDTATYWSPFGHLVIISLIQIGGMGVVTMAVAIAMVSGRKIGLRQRRTMQDAISAQQVGGIVRMTGFILKCSLFFELMGAIAFSFVFIPEYGLVKGIWYSVFHAISAFCNAGFDLMGVKGHFSSLTDYTGNDVVNLTVMRLIIIGGIGFAMWADFARHGFRVKRYRMQTKVVLTTSALLIFIPALYFYFFEFSLPVWNGMTLAEKLWASLFRSVTTRTAGFNTVDMTQFTEAGIMINVFLMLVGGSPGSTAGGMKTTTLAVLLATAIAVFRRTGNPAYYGRRIGEDAIRNAATVMTMYVVLCVSGAVIISIAEKLPMMTCLFETASAVGTVGLTLGITPGLSTISRLVLICLMYFGRVGGLTIIFATVKSVHNGSAKYPLEKITVG